MTLPSTKLSDVEPNAFFLCKIVDGDSGDQIPLSRFLQLARDENSATPSLILRTHVVSTGTPGTSRHNTLWAWIIAGGVDTNVIES